jgi:hypothetical protein
MSTDELCSLDAVVIIGQPGVSVIYLILFICTDVGLQLHANKLSSLSHKSHLKSRLQEARARVHFPYIPVSGVPETDTVARDIAALCGFAADEWSLGNSYEGPSKRVLYFDLPESTQKFWNSDGKSILFAGRNSYLPCFTR